MNGITTTVAAGQAGVSIATIRTWCRTGAIAAVKTAGRWIIDTASLAYRIKLPALLRQTRPVALTVENMAAIGGRRWQKAGHDRVYINDWAPFAGIATSHYGTGRISSASIGGRGIANSRVGRILGAVDKVWFDASDSKVYVSGWDHTTVEVRYLDGDRDTIDLATLIRDGIHAAIAAL
ncbi:hypothetical protein ACWEO1_22490 [Kitasatospora cineracea]